MADSVRQKKVARAAQKELATILIQNYGSTDLAEIMVSRVSVSPDLKALTMFYTLFSEKKRNKIEKALNLETKKIRHLLAKKLNHLKYVPEIFFKYDESFEKMERLDKILDDISKENYEKRKNFWV